MRQLGEGSSRTAVRLDDPDIVLERACLDERANWLATRIGLPAIGSKMVNRHGIEWVVQNHATVATADSLQRFRDGDIQPEIDLYPVVDPQNLSPELMEFFFAIDRCTTKTFVMLDTMPGRRNDGHVPGGNSIDMLSHPVSNLLFLDAARVHESVIAHELGHAWVQYEDECEDMRTMEDAGDPQRLKMVNFVQSFVLDLKVNELIRKKGFDMSPIQEDQSVSLNQLARALEAGYQPESPREEVFMALLLADEMVQRDAGRLGDLARFDDSLESIQRSLSLVASLASKLANAARTHGSETRQSIEASVDECLLASFKHCGECLDLDQELVLVNPPEPNIDKFPEWLPMLPPSLKCWAGRHMAKNDIPPSWAHSIGPTLAGRSRICFFSPEGVRTEVIVPHHIGPPTPYFGMDERTAEVMEINRQTQERRKQLISGGMPHPANPMELRELNEENRARAAGPVPPNFPQNWPKPPGRLYMAGLGRFLTSARLIGQIKGASPYVYARSNPTTYVAPSGQSPVLPRSLSGGSVPSQQIGDYVAVSAVTAGAACSSTGVTKLCQILCSDLICAGLSGVKAKICEKACDTIWCSQYGKGNYSHFYHFCWSKDADQCESCCNSICTPLPQGFQRQFCLRNCLSKCPTD